MHPCPLDSIKPAVEHPLQSPEVDQAFIGRLVRCFYGRVRADARLGPIFATHIAGDWEPHLEKMTDFWCSVVLKTGAYQGRPVPAHLKLKEVVESDFEIWLALFRETARELCEPNVERDFIEHAERIAKSLRLAMFFRLPQRAAAIEQAPCG